MWKFIRKNWLLILSFIYILSPIDILPEFILGPLGIIDDGLLVGVLLLRAFLSRDKEE